MADTYTQLHIHIIFSVKNRNALIAKDWRADLEKYIATIIQKHGHKLLAIYAMRDHIHIFIGYRPHHLLADLVKEIKTSSNHWVKAQRLTRYAFAWQKGYGAFSHSKSQVPTVVNYILNQEAHHGKSRSFKTEYLDILQKNGVDYKQEYLFDFFDDLYE